MKIFKVNLTRVYSVTIDAEDEKSARELTEFFIGDPEDKSNENHKLEYKFNIHKIEMLMNEAFESDTETSSE